MLRNLPPAPRGRGADFNPVNRFEPIHVELDDPADPAANAVATRYLRDTTRSIIARNQSPDVPFDASINPYRGCEHGCSYCYARPSHELLGFSAGLDFETKILVKEDAPALLRRELAARSWQPQVLGLSGVTDPYQPIERRLRITRGCLEVLADARNPVGVVTKNALIRRDLDLLTELAAHNAASVCLSVTTLDPTLAGRLEPRASSPSHRLAAIRALSAAQVPVGVLMAPIIPGLNDHEIPAVLEAAAEAGASFAGWVLLRLPGAVAPVFDAWLTRHAPGRRDKVRHRLQALRGGKLSDARFGHRMRGSGVWADEIRGLFDLTRRRHGLAKRGFDLSTEAFRPPTPASRGWRSDVALRLTQACSGHKCRC